MMKEKQINPELAKSKINEKLTIKKIVFHEFQIPDTARTLDSKDTFGSSKDTLGS